jgi:hypothetical protein
MSEQNQTTIQIIDDNGKTVGTAMCVHGFTVDEPAIIQPDDLVVDDWRKQVKESGDYQVTIECEMKPHHFKSICEQMDEIAIRWQRFRMRYLESAKELSDAADAINRVIKPVTPGGYGPQVRKKGKVKRW